VIAGFPLGSLLRGRSSRPRRSAAWPAGRSTQAAAPPSREALAKIIRREAEHTYHPACTARIGTESTGVVDPRTWRVCMAGATAIRLRAQS
jgi:choline dehydrogenase-like flavoprotein